MRVAFLSSYPPALCGVGDYTAILERHLNEAGVESRVFHRDRWPLWIDRGFYQAIRAYNPDVIHIHYPTVSFGASLWPPLLATLHWKNGPPVVVTLHEFSQLHPLRKAAVIWLGAFARAIVLTTAYERSALIRWLPGLGRRSAVIPIGSAIPFTDDRQLPRDPSKVVYFGLIRPAKGLEEFIELARISRAEDREFRFCILGNPQEKTGSYLEKLQQETRDLDNLEWRGGLSAETVAEELACSSYAYLPFPDGVSERRGSFLAAVGNGAPVVTTRGPQTPDEFSSAVCWAAHPREALEQLNRLAASPEDRERLRRAGESLVSHYTWNSSVREYLSLYEGLIHEGRKPSRDPEDRR